MDLELQLCVCHTLRSRGPACAVKYFPGSICIIAMLLLVAACGGGLNNRTLRQHAWGARTLCARLLQSAPQRRDFALAVVRAPFEAPFVALAAPSRVARLGWPWGGIVGRRLHVQVVVFSAPSCSFHATSRASIHTSSVAHKSRDRRRCRIALQSKSPYPATALRDRGLPPSQQRSLRRMATREQPQEITNVPIEQDHQKVV